MRFKIFISSVQSEFVWERAKIADYVRRDALLGRFFDVFLFEEVPACDRSAQGVYLEEVRDCDLYLALLGEKFGNEVSPGVSATECEYDLATELNKSRLAFLKRCTREDAENRFVAKVERSVVRKEFSTFDELQLAVYASLVNYLGAQGFVRMEPFDLAYDSKMTLADVDEGKIQDYLARARSANKISVPENADARWILEKLEAIDDLGRLSNAGVLLFAKDPQKQFDSAVVKCLQYWGMKIERPIPSYKTFGSGLIDQIEAALDYVMSRVDCEIGNPDHRGIATAKYELPRNGIREAIVNAVCHRDYESNAAIQVMLFRNRLLIMNPGTLPKGWTIETLARNHESRARNRILARALDWAGYVERSGHGTEFVIEQCLSQGLSRPEYESTAETFHAIIWRKGYASEDVESERDQVGTKPGPSRDQVGTKSTDQEVILALCREPKAMKELMATLGRSNRTKFRQGILQAMLDDGLIEMTIPDKPKSRLQKYRTTEKGVQVRCR